MTLRLNLGQYLKDHGISAYRLVQEVGGRVAPNTVYGLARKPAQRIDLGTVGTVLDALERLTGERVTVGDMLENVVDSPQESASLPPTPAQDTLEPSPSRKFRYSGRTFNVKAGGPSIEQMVAEDRGRTYP